MNKKLFYPFSHFLSDAYLVFAGVIYISGGFFLITGPGESIVKTHPWIHRFAVSGLAVSALVLFYLRSRLVSKGQAVHSPLMSFLLSLRIKANFLLWGMFFLAAFTWTLSSWLRHESFHSGFDMAIFVQAVWNTLHGHFLYSSIKGGICLLGDHFSPLLAALAVPYTLWADPRMLLLIQAAAAASCVFAVYRIAFEKGKSETTALLFSAAFILYLPVANAVRFDFHPEIIAMPLLLWSFYFLSQGRTAVSSIFLAVVLLSKENAALVTFAMGFYGFVFMKQRRFGILWMLVSAVYFWIVITYVIPFFSGQDYFYLSGNFLAWKEHGIAAFLGQIFRPESWEYLIKIFAPLGGLSVLNFPSLLLTFPMILQNVIARNEMAISIFFQYTAFLTPFVFISAIYGGVNVLSSQDGRYYFFACVLLMSGVSEISVMRDHLKKMNSNLDIIKQQMKIIPADASVRTHEFYAPHLAHRRKIHIYENTHPREGASEEALQSEYAVVNRAWMGDLQSSARARKKLEESGYKSVFLLDDFEILKRSLNHGL